jgi:hypothetical protein
MDKTEIYKMAMSFEDEVRRTAEAVWGLEVGTCQPEHYNDNFKIKELDGIVNIFGVVHVIMATVSRKLNKIIDDVKKLKEAERIELLSPNVVAVVKWMVTKDQLNAEHVKHCKDNNVIYCTLDQFRKKFFNGAEYIKKRGCYSFGSARNPKDDSVNIDDSTYVELPIYEELYEISSRTKNREVKRVHLSVADLVHRIIKGEHFVLLAPFGSGKSITTREIFRVINNKYLRDEIQKIAVCLNLREHWQQPFCDEILERHARTVGLEKKNSLVVAWRAGLAHLLLDGFDEVATQSFIRKDDIQFMKDARRSALEGVRDFVMKVPAGVGVFVCGRDHYFDDIVEMKNSLGFFGKSLGILRLSEFDEMRASEYLRKNGYSGQLPNWLPRKPLILSYVIKNDLIHDILQIDGGKGYGYAWNSFLKMIAEREASLERSAMDPFTIELVMERLAWMVRGTIAGTGPITGMDLSNAYKFITKQSAGDAVLAQLQRLPGLSQRNEDIGARGFIDEDMLASLQGRALAKCVLGEVAFFDVVSLDYLSNKAIDVASYVIESSRGDYKTVIGFIKKLEKDIDSSSSGSAIRQTMADCIALCLNLAESSGVDVVNFEGMYISGASICCIDMDRMALLNIDFSHCHVGELNFGSFFGKSKVTFHNCVFDKIVGVASMDMLPSGACVSCECNIFDNISNTNAIMSLSVDPSMKALLSMLKKLFRQSGGGRKKKALYRGITDANVLKYIDGVLGLLVRHGYVYINKDIVHPVRSYQEEALLILNAPSLINNPLVSDVRSL